MTDSLIAAELARERAAHRQTVEALELERTAHAETRLAGLALMEAANIHMGQLRDAIKDRQDHCGFALTILSDKLTAATERLATMGAQFTEPPA